MTMTSTVMMVTVEGGAAYLVVEDSNGPKRGVRVYGEEGLLPGMDWSSLGPVKSHTVALLEAFEGSPSCDTCGSGGNVVVAAYTPDGDEGLGEFCSEKCAMEALASEFEAM
jgi:hypothetical protein